MKIVQPTTGGGSGGGSIPGTITGGTDGSVLFIHPTNTLSQDNAQFYLQDSATTPQTLATNTNVAHSINVSGDFTGTDAINVYGQYDAFLLNSQITNTLAGFNTDGAFPGYTFSSSRGTAISLSQLQSGDAMGGVSGWGTVGASSPTYQNFGGMMVFATGSSTNNLGGELRFYTKADGGSLTQRMAIDNAGQLVFPGTQIFTSSATNGGFTFNPTGTGVSTFNSNIAPFASGNIFNNNVANVNAITAAFLSPNLISGTTAQGSDLVFGVAASTNNSGLITFNYSGGAGSSSNAMSLGIFGSGSTITITSSKVGIGTTSPFDRLASTAANIVDGGGVGATGSGSIVWGVNAAGYAQALYNASSNSAADGLLVKIAGTASTNKAFTVNTAAAQGTNGTDIFNVLGNGNVGIGTSSPANLLDVASGASHLFQVDGTTNNGQIIVGNTSNSNQLLVGSRNSNGIGYISGSASLTGLTLTTSSAAFPFSVALGGASYITAVSSNVGIGAVTSPTARLHLPAGTATANTAPLQFNAGTSETAARAGIAEYDGTNLFFTPSGTTRKVVSLYQDARSTAQTAAVASVVAWTVGAADGSFLISSNVNVTAFSVGTFNVTVAYTDETNTARTLTLNFSSVTGTLGIAIAAAGAFEGIPVHIRAKAATTITIATSGTFTSLTYNVEGAIAQIA